jgi:ribonuclease HII
MPPNLLKVPPTFATERSLLLNGNQHIAGVDEVGVGAIAGPIVAAAVILPLPTPGETFDRDLDRLTQRLRGIQDSKYLYRDQKERLFARIHEVGAVVGIGTVEVPELSTIQNQTLAASIATARALAALTLAPDFVLIDGRVSVATPAIPSVTITKIRGATTSISIAAASIIASVVFTRIMVAYGTRYPLYGFEHHRGYPSPGHIAALAQYGPSPIHHPHNKLVQTVESSSATQSCG